MNDDNNNSSSNTDNNKDGVMCSKRCNSYSQRVSINNNCEERKEDGVNNNYNKNNIND